MGSFFPEITVSQLPDNLDMKKLLSLLFYFSLLLAFVSCSQDSSNEDPLDVYREIAYNSLSVSEKSTLIGDWRDGEVSAWIDGYYLVTFNTTEDATLGPISIVVDPYLGVVVEKLPRF